MKLVLYGVETYCINNRVHQLIQEIDDMNVSRYQGLSREAVAATSRYPIMADKQAVIVETESLPVMTRKCWRVLIFRKLLFLLLWCQDLWKHGQMHSNP